MIWYWLALLGATLVTGSGIYTAFRFRKDKLDDFIDWIQGKVKRLLVIWAVVLGLVTLALTKPLWNTMTCQFDGMAYKVNTSYSWYKNGSYGDKCLFVGKNGALLPLRIIRDQPEGDHTADVIN